MSIVSMVKEKFDTLPLEDRVDMLTRYIFSGNGAGNFMDKFPEFFRSQFNVNDVVLLSKGSHSNICVVTGVRGNGTLDLAFWEHDGVEYSIGSGHKNDQYDNIESIDRQVNYVDDDWTSDGVCPNVNQRECVKINEVTMVKCDDYFSNGKKKKKPRTLIYGSTFSVENPPNGYIDMKKVPIKLTHNNCSSYE